MSRAKPQEADSNRLDHAPVVFGHWKVLAVNTIRFLLTVAIVIASSIAASDRATLCAATKHKSTHNVLSCADMWVVNTREMPCPVGQANVCRHARYQRWNGRTFQSSSREEYLSSLPDSGHSCVFVHGNRKTPESAQEQGFEVYRSLAIANRGMRFVIWSWPSDRVPGLLRDARVKADRADAEAFYLASFLSDYPSSADVSVFAFSFGARTATGALHLLGGGSVCGNQLAVERAEFVRPRVALLAAALPRQWLLPRGANGLALVQSSDVVSFYNQHDPLLKHFDIVFKPGKPQALGLEGINVNQFGPQGSVLRQYDASKSVGHTHSLSRYLESPGIMNTVRQRTVSPLDASSNALLPFST